MPMHTPLIFSPSFLGLSPPRRLNNRDKRPAWPSGRTVPSFCWSCTRHADAPVVVQMPLAPSKRVHASASKHESKTRTPIAAQVLPIVSRSVEKPAQHEETLPGCVFDQRCVDKICTARRSQTCKPGTALERSVSREALDEHCQGCRVAACWILNGRSTQPRSPRVCPCTRHRG